MVNDAVAIKANNLCKQFRIPQCKPASGFKLPLLSDGKNSVPLQALDEINFLVKKGETIGVIGRNGAGKTTLLKILVNILRPSSGTIEVNGKIVSVLELGLGFQHNLTARENIYLYGAIMGLEKKEIDKKFDEIISFAGLQKFVETPLKNFSSGMQLRLAFSTAIQIPADVFLVDEILAVGDLAFQEKCLAVFKKFQKEGKTIVLATHNMDLVKRFCKKVLWLENGKQTDFGNASEVVQKYFDLIESEKAKGKKEKDLLKIKALIRGIDDWLSPKEGLVLFNLAKKDKAKGAIVEINPFQGCSTVCLAEGAKQRKQSKVYSIGGHKWNPGIVWGELVVPQNAFVEFSRNISAAGLSDWVVPIKKNPLQVAKSWKKPIRLLFLCTLLAYKDVKNAFLAWEPHVKVGGLISLQGGTHIPWPLHKKISKDFAIWHGPTIFAEEFLLGSKKFTVVSNEGLLLTVRKIKK